VLIHGFEKGGSASTGVQRQYAGIAGKITNCQLGVFLACAGPRGRALAGRELYLPGSWTGDGQRMAAAGVPEGTAFRTRPQLLQLMTGRAVTAGIAFGWVTADEACGGNGPLRAHLEERGIAYVLAVARAHLLATPAGRYRAGALAAKLPKRAWQRMSCGDWARGGRRCDWALVASGRPEVLLLIRRSVSRPSGLAFCLGDTPGPVPLSRLVRAAGARWAAEECFQAARDEAGSAACSPPCAARRTASSTPAAGHDGAASTRNAPADVTASDSDCKITECRWRLGLTRRPGSSLPAAAGPASACRLLMPGGHMNRGEVWWAEFDQRRPVVLLSEDEPSGFLAMQVVAPAGAGISGLGIEVTVGIQEGLPFEGVLRVVVPRPGFTPCTWLTTLSRDDLTERAGTLSPEKLSEVDDARRAGEHRTEWTPDAAATLSKIKESLRPGGPQ
jgi:mRNA-degrading endonuclease toxin of MazEF toxin-antitoxin module